MKQVLRIIGGLYRGKKLHFPEVDGLRPTPDRVRETLFNWLMNDIRDARCLDAFAGSGALGLEAFSRGAAQVVFIEHSSTAHHSLKKNIAEFNSQQLQLLNSDALRYMQQCKEPFDIIFLDPPFALNYIPQCLNILAQYPVLRDGGLVYIESANPIEIDPIQWENLKLKRAGQVFYGLFKKL